MLVASPACLLYTLRQDTGQDVESYFQEVLAAAEQSAEEGSRGEGGALRGRLQQLYSEIVGETDAGKGRRRSKIRSLFLWNRASEASLVAHLPALLHTQRSNE